MLAIIAACRDAEQKPNASSSSAPAGTPSGKPKGPPPTLPDQLGSAHAEELQAAFEAEAPDPERKLQGELELRQRLAPFAAHGEPPHILCRASRCRLWLAGNEDDLREAIDAVRADPAFQVDVAAPEPRSDGKWLVQVFLRAR